MQLMIVSYTSHYLVDDKIIGWGPTVMEIDHLASLFDQVVHVAPLYQMCAPESSIPYSASNVDLIPVKPAGGNTIFQKIGVLFKFPQYAKILISELKDVDLIHIRCPANISLLSLVIMSALKKPNFRWVKFAGNWRPEKNEPFSYKFQRFLLEKNVHRGVVTINGRWPGQPPHVLSFPNPCLTDMDILQGQKAALEKSLAEPIRIVFVGRLERAKGAWRVLEITSLLKRAGLKVLVDIIGDGPERNNFQKSIHDNQINEEVRFQGWLPKSSLRDFYARAHFILHPSESEGWPKVLSEAMAYGAVPLASNVSSIPQILNEIDKDLAVIPTFTDAFVARILRFVDEPDSWKKVSLSGLETAQRFTYSNYQKVVSKMVYDTWGIPLKSETNQNI